MVLKVNELEGSKIEGSIVASDASKRIVVKNLQPGIEWGENGSSGSDTDDEEPEEEKLQKEEEEVRRTKGTDNCKALRRAFNPCIHTFRTSRLFSQKDDEAILEVNN